MTPDKETRLHHAVKFARTAPSPARSPPAWLSESLGLPSRSGRAAPLPPREKSSIKSSLIRELPHLLSLKDEISEAAMNLAKQYDVEVEAP